MDGTHRLTSGPATADEASVRLCADCGTDQGPLPPVEIDHFEGAAARRCPCCGTRWTCGPGRPRRILSCDTCELPFPQPGRSESGRCADCECERFHCDGADGNLSAATESELRSALRKSWTFVGSDAITSYLDRVARDAALRLGVDAGGVLVVSESSVRTLALPSGTILLSEGVLRAVEDEAELAFVLGRELTHAASPEAARPLVRLALRALARGGRDEEHRAWTRAALDLVRLGRGEGLEYDADTQAVRALSELGYDPSAARRYLERVEGKCREGAVEYAELALARPPAAHRLRRLDGVWIPPVEGPGYRTNREVFRRTVGHSVLARELTPVDPFDERATAMRWTRTLRVVAWTVVGLVALAALLLVLGI